MHTQSYTHKLGNTDITFEINDWMAQADASVIASMGDTKVMIAIALGGPTDKDYMPLKVEYQERFYARGEILGSKYNKREGKPSDEATLTARVIDRAIRPYFPKDFNRDINVVVTVLSLGSYDPDIVAMNGTTLALEISSIPWRGTVGAARIVQNEAGVRTISPTYTEQEDTNVYDAVVAARAGRLVMLELEGSETVESDVEVGIQDAITEIEKFESFVSKIVTTHKKEQLIVSEKKNRLMQTFETGVRDLISINLADIQDKGAMSAWKSRFTDDVHSTYDDATYSEIQNAYESGVRSVIRSSIIADHRRIDGRAIDELRPIFAQAGGVSDIVHGSGLFYRGETHVLSVITLGQLSDALHINGMEVNTEKNFIHHYNFPPYSVGEVGRMGSPGRREIGHGALAGKGLRRMIPLPEVFPYTMRVVSEVLSSNGSTSMASTCGASLALHDAGVPLKSHVAGIAIGLVYESDESYQILTDILGKEDHFGDMDFKVAGTHTGITAIQLDCKFDGLTPEMITETLSRAKQARTEILSVMEKELVAPRELTPAVERIETIKIPSSKIGLVIGTGGVTIKKITKESGAKVDIKRDGSAFIMGQVDSIGKAKEMITQVLGMARE